MQKRIIVLFLQILIASSENPNPDNGYGEPVQGNGWWALPNSSEGLGFGQQKHFRRAVPTTSSFPPRTKRNAHQLTAKCEGMQTHLDRVGKLIGEEILDALAERNEEIQGLEEKVGLLRGQVRALQKDIEVKQGVLEAQSKDVKSLHKTIMVLSVYNGNDKEVVWLKSTCLKNSNWNTELHLAASRREEDTVKNLVGNGAYIDPRNKFLQTPLIMAMAGGHDRATGFRILQFLIDNGANVYAKSHTNRTFLDDLVVIGTSLTPSQFHDISAYLISRNLSSMFHMPLHANGWCPLHSAVRNIDVLPATLLLLQRIGVDLNEASGFDKASIIRYALDGKRSLKFLSDLTGLGVNWRYLDNNRKNMLHLAAEFGHLEGVKYYCKLGLGVNSIDSVGHTPLHKVVLLGKENILEIVEALIVHGANPAIKANDGKTALDGAVERENMPDKDEVIKLLRDNL